MPSSKQAPEGGKPRGNRKVMVYVAPNVHRAMEHLATDENRSTSSVYVEAARDFLEARGRPVDADPVPTTPPAASAASGLAEAIDRQGARIAELHAAMEGILRAGPPDGQGSAGTKAAEAMKAVLGILKAAGAAGMTGREIDAAAQTAGIRSGASETAKAVLRGAGVVRCEGKRWYLDGA
ncbi:hypothetical protein [Methylobacterium sp. D54C]